MDNNYDTVLGVKARRLMTLILLILMVFDVYLIISAIVTVETTGVLKVSATQKATISVSQANSQAKVVGKPGKVQIRLKPGTYQIVAAASNGQVAAQQVSIKKKQSTVLSLAPTTSPKLPSVSSVSFFGMSALTNLGISPAQSDALKLAFFHFKPSAGAVSVNTNSVQTLPYKLGGPSVIAFNVAVDSQTYGARITYADMQNIQLQLYNRQNSQLIYDSAPPASVKNLD